MMPCLYKKYLGVECPGCGFQRALLLLLQGEWEQSLAMYPPLLPVLGMLLLLTVHLVFKPKNGAIWLKYWFIFTISTIVIHYIYKQIIWFH
jgi:hypothetical protein